MYTLVTEDSKSTRLSIFDHQFSQFLKKNCKVKNKSYCSRGKINKSSIKRNKIKEITVFTQTSAAPINRRILDKKVNKLRPYISAAVLIQKC